MFTLLMSLVVLGSVASAQWEDWNRIDLPYPAGINWDNPDGAFKRVGSVAEARRRAGHRFDAPRMVERPTRMLVAYGLAPRGRRAVVFAYDVPGAGKMLLVLQPLRERAGLAPLPGDAAVFVREHPASVAVGPMGTVIRWTARGYRYSLLAPARHWPRLLALAQLI